MTFRTSLRSIVTAFICTVAISACTGLDGPRQAPAATQGETQDETQGETQAAHLEDDDTRIDFTIEVRAKAPPTSAQAFERGE